MCRQGDRNGYACSADHRLIEEIFRRRPGVNSCQIDGACGDCGRRKTVGEECQEAVDLQRAAYLERLRNICPAPRPNELIPPECLLPGCFGDDIPSTAPICRFAQCDGRQPMSLDLACSCCTSCQPGAPPAMTGTSPSCQGAPDCRECCISCEEVAAGQVCPPPVDITAPEVPPAWMQGPQ
jgi:hypothetical protein